jgi:hypothetical protein
MCVLCREANSIMNQGHILKCSSKYWEYSINCKIILGC